MAIKQKNFDFCTNFEKFGTLLHKTVENYRPTHLLNQLCRNCPHSFGGCDQTVKLNKLRPIHRRKEKQTYCQGK